MTIRREYSCNLCREAIRGERIGYGVYFTGSHGIELKRPCGAENHICERCLSALDAIPDETREQLKSVLQSESHS